MSSQQNKNSSDNARRFLWDDTSGDADLGVSSSSHHKNKPRSRGMTKAGGGFSTRDFKVVDQSVNLMDIGEDDEDVDKSSGAQGKHKHSEGAKSGGGLSGLFRASMETDNLSRFDDEYGDADAMNQADAEEYIDAKRRRYFLPLLFRKTPSWKALLTLFVAVMAIYLVFSAGNSFEELEEEEREEEREKNKSTVSNSNFHPGNSLDNQDNTVLQSAFDPERFETIKQIVVDSGATSAEVLDSDKASPQQSALHWLVFEDPHSVQASQKALVDRYGLAVLWFSSTNSQTEMGWKKDDNWMSDKGICKWHGIECVLQEQDANLRHDFEPYAKTYNLNDHVVAINLPSNGIKGTIPPEIGTAFPELITVDLEDNYFEGTLPESLSKVIMLRILLLGNNKFTGTLPEIYSKLHQLHQINLSHNRFEGEIWDSWTTNLKKLRFFAAAHNSLTGTFPDFFGHTRMTGLILDGNQFEGTLPDDVGEMTGLLDLRISDNKFSGSINVLSNLQNLETLHLANNEFTGSIPEMFDELFRLHELVLPNNKFTGTIPNTLTHLQLLKTLNLDANMFEGTLPPGLGLLTDAITISLKGNSFEGTIPTFFGKLDDIKNLVLDHNNLEGTIPTELGGCFRLQMLHLEHNSLSGDIPAEIGELVDLESLHMEGNNFNSVSMPPQICSLRKEDLSVLSADCKKDVDCICCTDCY